MIHWLQVNSLKIWLVIRGFLVVGGILTVLISLVGWGGTARSGPLFVVGVVLLISLILTFGLITAWVFTSPFPSSHPLTPEQIDLRAIIAVLTTISSSCFMIGGAWDEIWHRRYGGFGNDFFWPPHITVYGSIALFMLFALMGLSMAIRRPGSLRQRFRAESQLGLIGLISVFLLISLPSDIIWHRIYGKDITAWSLPHIVATCGGLFVTLSGASLALTFLPRSPTWSGLRALKWPEILALLMIATITMTVLQVGTTEWEGIRSLRSNGDVFKEAFWRRPQWLYPVVIMTLTAFFSNFTLHLLRRAGVATITALLILGFRFTCLTLLGDDITRLRLGYISHLLFAIPAIVFDSWYAFWSKSADNVLILVGGNLIAALVFLVVGLPIIDAMLIYPPINGFTIPRIIIIGMIMTLASGWLGARFGRWLSALDRSSVPLRPRPPAVFVAVGGSSLAILVIVIMLLTAEAPPRAILG